MVYIGCVERDSSKLLNKFVGECKRFYNKDIELCQFIMKDQVN